MPEIDDNQKEHERGSKGESLTEGSPMPDMMAEWVQGKAIWGLIIAILLAIGILAQWEPFAQKSDMAIVSSKLDELSLQVGSVATTVNNLEKQNAVLTEDLSHQSASLATVMTQVATDRQTEQEDVHRLEQEMNTQAIHIEGLEADEKAHDSQDEYEWLREHRKKGGDR
jgi:uncharacterized protein YoxC